MQNIFTLTAQATQRLQDIITAPSSPFANSFFRIQVHGGGCAGFKYELNFDATPAADDVVLYAQDAVRVLTDTTSMQFLQNCTLDFVSDLVGDSFKIINPQAKSSCGCGVSFSL